MLHEAVKMTSASDPTGLVNHNKTERNVVHPSSIILFCTISPAVLLNRYIFQRVVRAVQLQGKGEPESESMTSLLRKLTIEGSKKGMQRPINSVGVKIVLIKQIRFSPPPTNRKLQQKLRMALTQSSEPVPQNNQTRTF